MNSYLARYLLYHPVTFLKGERVHAYRKLYEAFQWKPAAEIAAYQLEALRRLVAHAYERVPFYRESFDAAGVTPSDLKSLADLRRFPCLEKEDLRRSAERLSAVEGRGRISRKTTGGSTGQAVTVLKDCEALARERAATWRAYAWAGVDVGDPQARFWGVPLTRRSRLVAKVVDFIANRKRLSAFGVNAEAMERYHRQIQRFKPAYFYGYVSMVAQFADFLRERGYRPPASLRSVITTSEVLDPQTRRRIEEACGCRVFNEYGCGEVGSIAHECEHGSLHLMDDNLVVEIDPMPNLDPGDGEIVVTDLFNYAMPLVRYRLRDFAARSTSPCACGRGLGVLRKVYGRAYDLIRDRSGKTYHPELVMYVFEDLKRQHGGVRQFQLLQRDLDTLQVSLVASDLDRRVAEDFLRAKLTQHLGPGFAIEFAYVPEIPRERSGKIRLIKSELPLPAPGASRLIARP